MPGGSGHAEVDGGGGAGPAVDLGELVFGAGEADFEAFGFAEPALLFGFGDAGEEVVADLGDAGALGGVWPVHGAPQAGVLVDARGAERPPAGAGGDLAALEVPEEFLPFGVGEADLQAFGFAEPAFAFGFGDAGDQVVADLGDAGAGVGEDRCDLSTTGVARGALLTSTADLQ